MCNQTRVHLRKFTWNGKLFAIHKEDLALRPGVVKKDGKMPEKLVLPHLGAFRPHMPEEEEGFFFALGLRL